MIVGAVLGVNIALLIANFKIKIDTLADMVFKKIRGSIGGELKQANRQTQNTSTQGNEIVDILAGFLSSQTPDQIQALISKFLPDQSNPSGVVQPFQEQ